VDEVLTDHYILDNFSKRTLLNGTVLLVTTCKCSAQFTAVSGSLKQAKILAFRKYTKHLRGLGF
jgi:hypothetical protein